MRPYRNLKIANLIQIELAKLLLKEFEFAGALVTITKVEILEDLAEAEVSLGIIPAEKEVAVWKEIDDRKRELQHKLLRKMNIKPMPKLKFTIDKNTAG